MSENKLGVCKPHAEHFLDTIESTDTTSLTIDCCRTT